MGKSFHAFAGILQKDFYYYFQTAKIKITNKDINAENGQVASSLLI